MGFLRRLLGGSGTRDVEMTLDVTYFTRIRGDASVPVVGEAYRQELVLRARPPGPDDMPAGVAPPPPGYYKAMVFRQPDNPADSNAVAVTLWAGSQWSLAGYLSRTDAGAYRPLFDYLQRVGTGSPPGIVCDAALISERGGAGVVLHLGTPGECIAELVTDDRVPSQHRWVDASIAFTGDGSTSIHGVALDRQGQTMIARWAGCAVSPRLTKRSAALVVADPQVRTENA
jgi:hypothetical protein